MSGKLMAVYAPSLAPPACAGCSIRVGTDFGSGSYEVIHVAPDGARHVESFGPTVDAQERIRRWLASLHVASEAKP